ncbi:MAG: hydroxymethylbilane synthase [Nitrospinaceae bacterium]
MYLEKIRIGTRGSPLALWQAEWVKSLLEKENAGRPVELHRIQTSGDKIQDVALAKIGGKGLFTKEIEESLLHYQTDLAVHSMKDVPVKLPTGLGITVVLHREDPRDALVSKDGSTLKDLREGARIGTGSLRRTTQLLAYRPDFEVVPLRGNVETRLRKIETENLDAVILAAAGLIRLGFADRITESIAVDILLPGVGQGAVGIETRRQDLPVINAILPLDHEATHRAIEAERAFLKRLEGGCQVPIGAYATIEGEVLRLQGMVGSLDGKRTFKAEKSGSADDSFRVGHDLAGEILAMGADQVLKEIYDAE